MNVAVGFHASGGGRFVDQARGGGLIDLQVVGQIGNKLRAPRSATVDRKQAQHDPFGERQSRGIDDAVEQGSSGGRGGAYVLATEKGWCAGHKGSPFSLLNSVRSSPMSCRVRLASRPPSGLVSSSCKLAMRAMAG